MLSRPEATPLEPLLATLFQPVSAFPTLLLAVSGGPDSMALLHLAVRWAAGRSSPPRLFAATVDHGLRDGAAAEAQAVADWCRALGVTHAILRWTGDKPRTRLQERAREARYALLADRARAVQAGAILTAHHADDQAETVLFRLARGSGIAGLAGMAAVSPFGDDPGRPLVLARPLLGIGKDALVDHCVRVGQRFVTDPSNTDVRFARARWRRLSHSLAAEGLDAPGLLRLARRAARADAALRQATLALRDAVAAKGTLEPLATAPAELVVRWLIGEVERQGGGAVRLDRAEAFAERLAAAVAAGAPLTGTLGGLVLRLDCARSLWCRRENRRRGRAAGTAGDATP